MNRTWYAIITTFIFLTPYVSSIEPNEKHGPVRQVMTAVRSHPIAYGRMAIYAVTGVACYVVDPHTTYTVLEHVYDLYDQAQNAEYVRRPELVQDYYDNMSEQFDTIYDSARNVVSYLRRR